MAEGVSVEPARGSPVAVSLTITDLPATLPARAVTGIHTEATRMCPHPIASNYIVIVTRTWGESNRRKAEEAMP